MCVSHLSCFRGRLINGHFKVSAERETQVDLNFCCILTMEKVHTASTASDDAMKSLFDKFERAKDTLQKDFNRDNDALGKDFNRAKVPTIFSSKGILVLSQFFKALMYLSFGFPQNILGLVKVILGPVEVLRQGILGPLKFIEQPFHSTV